MGVLIAYYKYFVQKNFEAYEHFFVYLEKINSVYNNNKKTAKIG